MKKLYSPYKVNASVIFKLCISTITKMKYIGAKPGKIGRVLIKIMKNRKTTATFCLFQTFYI